MKGMEEIKDKWIRMPNNMLVAVEAQKDIKILVNYIEELEKEIKEMLSDYHKHKGIKE